MNKRNHPHSQFDFTLDPQAIRDGNWSSRDANPVALVVASKLPPDTVLYVDVMQDEYYLRRGNFSQWYGLPGDMANQIGWSRAAIEQGENVAAISFTLWIPDCLFQ